MEFFQWNPSLETGYNLIDNQHKQLMAMLNDMMDAYHNGTVAEKSEQALDFLIAYTIKHFSDEEKLQVLYQYPDYERHKQIHNEFRLSVKELTERLGKEGVSNALFDELCVFVGNWLVTHIQGEDFALASFIKNKEN